MHIVQQVQKLEYVKFISLFVEYTDKATRHVMMRQGVLGIKVSIMLPYDPLGKQGPSNRLPDIVTILEPKENRPRPVAHTHRADPVEA